MEIREPLRQALESLTDHPRRIVASSMGVLWGAAALLMLMGWGTGFADYMRNEFSRFGKPSLFMIPGVTSSGFPGYRAGVPVRLSREDADRAERENAGRVIAVVGEHYSQERALVETRHRVLRLDLLGTGTRFPEFRNFRIEHGRFFDEVDVARARGVVVLGSEAAAELFPVPARAIGEALRIDGQAFELIGVLGEKTGMQYNNTNRPDNRLVIVPGSAAEERLGYDAEALSLIQAYIPLDADIDEVKRGVLESLARGGAFHPDDEQAMPFFSSLDMFAMMDLMEVGFTGFVGIAGVVTLLVAGVGLANYHLATLAEREVEIAVQKAIGATDRRLTGQVVLEAWLVSATAALLGLLIGLLGSLVIVALAPPGVFPVPVISGSAVALTSGALVAVAVITAAVPAVRVRGIEVSVALRAET